MDMTSAYSDFGRKDFVFYVKGKRKQNRMKEGKCGKKVFAFLKLPLSAKITSITRVSAVFNLKL